MTYFCSSALVISLSQNLIELHSVPSPPVVPFFHLGWTDQLRPLGNWRAKTIAMVHPQHFTQTLIFKVVEKYDFEVVIGKLEHVDTELTGWC